MLPEKSHSVPRNARFNGQNFAGHAFFSHIFQLDRDEQLLFFAFVEPVVDQRFALMENAEQLVKSRK